MKDYKTLSLEIKNLEYSINPKKFTERFIGLICKHLKYEYGSVLLFDEGDKSQVYVSFQLPEYHPIFFDNIRKKHFTELSKADNELSKSFIIKDILKESFLKPWHSLILSLELQEITIIPIKDGGHTIGLIILYSSLNNSTSDKDISVIEQFSFIINLAIGLGKKLFEAETQRKNLETELKESLKKQENYNNGQKQYKELIENMGEALAIVDKEENFIFANTMVEKMFGVEQYELIGRCLSEFMTDNEYQKILKQTELRKKGKKSKYQIRITTPNGETKLCSINASPYFNENNEYVGALGIFRDITATKWTESIQNTMYKISEAANKAENLDELYRLIHLNLGDLMNTNNFYIAMYDEDSDLISFPYFKDELDSQPMPSKPSNGLTEYIIKTGTPLLVCDKEILKMAEDKLIERKGPPAVDWLGVPLKINNKVIGVMVIQSYHKEIRFSENEKNILVFVSEQIAMAISKKRAEATLKQSQQFLKEAQQIAKLGSWEYNYLTTEYHYSENFFEIIDISDENKIGFDFEKHLQIVHPEDKEKFKTYHSPDKEILGEDFRFIYRIVNKEGATKYIYNSGTYKRGDNNIVFKIIVNIQDITEQKHSEELLQEVEISKKSAELKQQFLANMSHEIRTPLNAIIGFTKLLEKSIKQPKERGYIETILSSSNTLLVLINDILDLSKIDAGQLELKFTPFYLKDIINDIRNIFLIKIEEKKLNLILDIPEKSSKRIYLDETRIRQILLNLVGNAIKFTDNGHIKISLTCCQPQKDNNLADITITVEDTGIGIPDEQKDRIFELFTQASGQSYRKYGGTGLGLSISKKLIEIMGGMIRVESEKDKGSKFIIEFPRVLMAVDEFKERISAEYTSESLPYEYLKFLIINKNGELNKYFDTFAKANDIEVHHSDENLENISRIVDNSGIDMIICDTTNTNIAEYTISQKLIHLKTKVPILALIESTCKIDLLQMNHLNFDGIIRQNSNPNELKLLFYKYFITKKRRNKPKFDINTEQFEGLNLQLSNKNTHDLPELIHLLEKRILPAIHTIQKSPRINQIKDIAKKMEQIGDKYQMLPLQEYGKLLFNEATHFNIGNIKELSDHFVIFVENLKQKAQDSHD